MRHLYRLNNRHWLAVAAISLLCLFGNIDRAADSIPAMFFTILFSFLIAYALIQGSARDRLEKAVLALIVKTSSSDPENKLFDRLHQLFKAEFPKESVLIFNGFDCNEEQGWFYFNGADPDVIMKAIQPLLKDIPLPEGSHLLVKIGPSETRELPVFATV